MQTLKIKLIADLLCATGESNAFVDANPVFDEYGLPYIKGKTFKGLLKEAANEVEEIMQFSDPGYKGMTAELFGDETTEGKIQIPDVRVEDYDNIVLYLPQTYLSPRDCRNYFTTTRRQTALEQNSAKKNSLRTYKLLRADRTAFEVTVDYPEKFSGLMDKAILQLRNIGLRRNRGFGKITISKSGAYFSSKLNNPVSLGNHSDRILRLRYSITALDPLHLSRPVGDQNTESTEDYIPGSVVRGIVARSLINRNKLGSDAHKDELFRKLILGDIIYDNAGIQINDFIYRPMPLAISYTKSDSEKIPVNVLETEKGGGKTFPKWARSIYLPNENVSVKLVQQFHQSRQNRLAGKSTEDEGSIFYYESIAKGQVFSGEITGPENQLLVIQKLLIEGNHRVGGSKATQYGRVSFNTELCEPEKQPITMSPNDTYYLVFQSNLLLYNEFGYSQPTTEILSGYLAKVGLELTDPVCAASRIERVEGYYYPWNARTDLEYAYAMGSTFKVIIKNIEKLNALGFRIGERQSEGFGQFRLYMNLLKQGQSDHIKWEKKEGCPTAQNEVPMTLLNIQEEVFRKSDEDSIKYNAIKWAKEEENHINLTNHQINRLIQYINKTVPENKESIDNWKKFAMENNYKTIVSDLDEKCYKNGKWDPHFFRRHKLFSQTLFYYLRIKSKRNG